MVPQEVFETARRSQSPALTAPRRPRLFGQYLVDQGAVTNADIAEARALMRLVNSPVGEIAIGEGLLSPEQVQTILDAQRRVDGHFFELAVSLGLGSRHLETLCNDQAVENLRFGDALVEVGAISSTSLEEHFANYEAEEHSSSPRARLTSQLAQCITDLIPRIARRAMCSAVRFGPSRPWDGQALDVHATATTCEPEACSLGLSVENAVANRMGPQPGPAATTLRAQLAPLLVADIVGLTVDMALRKRGHCAEASLSPCSLPTRGVCFDVAFETGAGILVLDVAA